jgi:hypothetical protein
LQKPVVVKHAQRDFATRNLDPKARLLANGVLDLTEFGVKAMVPVVGLLWASASAASETASDALVQGDTHEGAMKKAIAAGLETYVTGKAAEGLLKNTGGFIKDAKGGKIGAAGNDNILEKANYAQTDYRTDFSKTGQQIYSKLAGKPIKTIDDLTNALKSGLIKPSDFPIDYIIRDGNVLILNTRSSQALTQAGIPRSQWDVNNKTGVTFFEESLTNQLNRNELSSKGIPTVTRSGGY